MNSAGQTFKNFVALSGAQAVTMVTGLITTIILARVLGPETYGVLGFGVATISYFMLVVNMGVDVYGMREIAYDQSRADEIVGTIVPLRFSLATVVFCLLYLLTITMDQPERVKTVLLIQGLGLFATALTIDFVYQGFQRMGVIALRQCIAAIAGVGLVIVLVSTPNDLYEAAAIPVTVGIATCVGLFIYFLRQGGQPIFSVNISGWLSHLKRASPVAFIMFTNTILFNMDIIFLGFMREQVEVGWYIAAVKVLTFALLVAGMLHNAFLPALSAAANDTGKQLAISREYAAAIMFIGAPICFLGIVFPAPIIEILFGAGYAEAKTALVVLMLAVFAAHLSMAHSTPLFAWKLDKQCGWIVSIAAIINVALNMLLIPYYGIEGAAAATLVSQVWMWVSMAAYTFWRYQFNHFGLIARTTIATAAGGLPTHFGVKLMLADPIPSFIIGGAVFAVIYTATAQAIGVYDLKKIRGLLRRTTL